MGERRTPVVLSGPTVAVLMQLASLLAAAPSRSSSVELGGWITYWDLERGLERVDAVSTSALEDVFLFSAALSPDGRIVLVPDGASVRGTVARLRGDGKRVWLTIVNDVHPDDEDVRPTLKDGALVHRILSDPLRRAVHRDGIVAAAKSLGVSGIDIDYENLSSSDRERFTNFIVELSSELRREGIRLSVTVQPKHRESRSVGPGANDWGALCPLVDRLQIMLYNEHSGKTGPGPMATRSWMSRVLEHATEQCDPSTIVPVVKVSGMEWSPAGVRSLHYEDAIELARRHEVAIGRDASEPVPTFRYDTEDGAATVFFEDATSIGAKVQLIRSLGFTRAVLWSVGREDPQILSPRTP